MVGGGGSRGTPVESGRLLSPKSAEKELFFDIQAGAQSIAHATTPPRNTPSPLPTSLAAPDPLLDVAAALALADVEAPVVSAAALPEGKPDVTPVAAEGE